MVSWQYILVFVTAYKGLVMFKFHLLNFIHAHLKKNGSYLDTR